MSKASEVMEHGWQEYMGHIYPDGACEECLKQTKQAFYSGAMVMFIGMETISNSCPSPQAEQMVRELMESVTEQLKQNWPTAQPNE